MLSAICRPRIRLSVRAYSLYVLRRLLVAYHRNDFIVITAEHLEQLQAQTGAANVFHVKFEIYTG